LIDDEKYKEKKTGYTKKGEREKRGVGERHLHEERGKGKKGRRGEASRQ
jgi:hypothetical protein